MKVALYYVFLPTDPQIDYSKSFVIESNLMWLSGAENVGSGLVWAYQDENNYYSFCVTPNGYYRIDRTLRSNYLPLIPWTYCADIVNKGMNTLKIVHEDGYIKFFVNKVFIDQIPYTASAGQQLGFVAYKNQKGKWSDLSISYRKISDDFYDIYDYDEDEY